MRHIASLNDNHIVVSPFQASVVDLRKGYVPERDLSTLWFAESFCIAETGKLLVGIHPSVAVGLRQSLVHNQPVRKLCILASCHYRQIL